MRTKKRILLLFLLPLIFLNTSCEYDRIKSLVDVNKSDVFKLRVLNEQGEETNTFQEGENIIFSFLVINKTDEDLSFYHAVMNLENFFEVYKLTAKGGISLGKPYNEWFFTEKLLLYIKANDSLDIFLPWVEDESIYSKYKYIGCENYYPHSKSTAHHIRTTTPLKKGEYLTRFSSSLKLGRLETEVLNFEARFTVE